MKELPLTGIEIGRVSPGVLVVGDPARAELAADMLDEPVLLADRREYRSFNGRFQGQPLTICSHGIGAPGAAIAFEELIAGGARKIIRAGTCGGLQTSIVSGDLIVASAAVQKSGYGILTVPDGYPAAADARLVLTLAEQAEKAGRPARTGLVLSSDSFYPGLSSRRISYQEMSEANVLAVEMECAALFIVGSLRRVQTAAILAVDGNVLTGGELMEEYRPKTETVKSAVEAEIIIAFHALLAQ